MKVKPMKLGGHRVTGTEAERIRNMGGQAEVGERVACSGSRFGRHASEYNEKPSWQQDETPDWVKRKMAR